LNEGVDHWFRNRLTCAGGEGEPERAAKSSATNDNETHPMDENVERRIRDRAYRIWEEEGRPADRDVEHWLRAAQEVAAEEGSDAAAATASAGTGGTDEADAAAKPKKARAPRSAAAKPTGAKAAAGTAGKARKSPKTE
jgi:hypothetical protein